MTSPTGTRGFLRLGRGVEAEFAHRVNDAPLHGLEAVADERQRAVEHDVHRIVEIGALGVVLERNLFVAGLQVHRGSGEGGTRMAAAGQSAIVPDAAACR
jgi:hypothetical protein